MQITQNSNIKKLTQISTLSSLDTRYLAYGQYYFLKRPTLPGPPKRSFMKMNIHK